MSSDTKLTIGQYSTAGRKESNEDSYGVLFPDPPLDQTKGIAMVIADGVSSAEAGKAASESCVKNFLMDYFATPESWTVRTAAWRVLSALNQWLHGQGHKQHGSGHAMISTFTGAVLKSGTLHIFHAGDSRLSRLRGGDLEPLTRDHRRDTGGGNYVLGRAMGAELSLEIDYNTFELDAGDILTFTTDGVHEFVDARVLSQLIHDHRGDLDAAAKAIADAAYDNNSNDNLTVQLVRVDALPANEADAYIRRLQTLPFPPPLSEGMKLDGYRVIRELHASKRTQLYLAIEEQSGDKVVLKTPSVSYQDDPQFLELFTREEWVGKLIDNEHVLKVREPFQARQFLFYVADYIEGPTLRQWMHDNPAPELDAVRNLLGQVAQGLRAFHRREMIHQDLKPENIVIDPFGTAKVIDFGSVKIGGLAEIKSPIESVDLLGTIGYTAPEYARGQQPTNRADIYSLGCIAYEMLTGQLPYGDGFATARAVERAQATPAIDLNPDLPAWISGALAKATHIDPARRYDSLSEFLTDLSQPNPDLVQATDRPLLESNPVAFWQGVSGVLAAIIVVLLYLLAR